jgi:tRNA modification GTPase
MSDTIVALATPSGRSGIGVVRLSGSEAVACAGMLIGRVAPAFEPRRAALRTIVDPLSGDTVDEAVLTYFQAPHSFTGEDVIEISCHGSPVLLRMVIDACLRFGARMAEPGEFTLRALANGQIDLSQAEAIRDVINARTAASARQAVRQMRGELSVRLQPFKDSLLDAIVILESALEFVEDDLPEMQVETLRRRLEETADGIDRIRSTFQAGRLLREGLKAALAGRPNVGKSSLFNALLGSERAIVTDIAGTTRDQISESFSIDGVAVTLMDTAGLRETSDTVESLGVERSRQAVADADLVLAILDGAEPFAPEDEAIVKGLSGLQHIIVINKIDRAEEANIAGIRRGLEQVDQATPVVEVSAKTGHGLEELKKKVLQPFVSGGEAGLGDTGFLITDARHFDLLSRASDDIASSLELLDARASEELTLTGLHNALRYIGEITGETTTEDMLTRIFSTFCIGK